jgi:uncharacterized protein (DUF1778 family)
MSSTIQRNSTRDQAINIRATKRERDLIDQAAEKLGKSRSDFMLETACQAAEDVLIDQRFFLLDAEAFDRFVDLIDNPPEPSDALRRLMARKPRWK